MMRNVCFKKVLVVGIIVLFIGVSVVSSVSSRNISSPIEKLIEHGNESDDNDEIEPLDSSDEIISFISGGAYVYHREGFIIQHIVCDSGRIRIFAISSNWFPELIIAKSLEAERFIGFFFPVANYWNSFSGIAFGNIEWEYY